MSVRYSIRLVMLVTLIVSMALAIFVHFRNQQQRRLQAMTQIERDGGFVMFRTRGGAIPLKIDDEVRRRDRVEAIYLANSGLEKETLELLASLDDVMIMSFNSSALADHHLKYLAGLDNLRELQLNGTRIAVSGLDQIATQHRLTLLTLNDTRIGDEAVAALSRMKSLRKLLVRNTELSEKGLQELEAALPDCQVVY